MSEGKIIDYSRQVNVNRIYAIIVLIFIAGGVYLFNYFPMASLTSIIIVDLAGPSVLFVISLIFGYGSKKAIDYIPGEWEKRKVWVSFSEYEELVDKYEEAYGDLFAHPGDSMTGCCLLIFVGVIAAMTAVVHVSSLILISSLIDSILLIVFLYVISSVAAFVIGFRIPNIDSDDFFKLPVTGDTYEFASQLEGVTGIRAGMNVEIGVRGGTQTILDAEVKSYIQGLPDTVQVRVQVSHSGFAYPYLVGTVYKGFPVETTSESHKLRGAKYRVALEYSMDDEVVVIVARFDIPKRSSGMPNITTAAFRKLAAFLAVKLKENYETSVQE
ncbi:MAG: hypothetical protein ACFFEV_08240 [Candidatus Thorarchaeota archaeon]